MKRRVLRRSSDALQPAIFGWCVGRFIGDGNGLWIGVAIFAAACAAWQSYMNAKIEEQDAALNLLRGQVQGRQEMLDAAMQWRDAWKAHERDCPMVRQ